MTATAENTPTDTDRRPFTGLTYTNTNTTYSTNSRRETDVFAGLTYLD